MEARRFAVGLGIAVFFCLAVTGGVDTFSPAPQWQDYQIRDYHSRLKDAAPGEKERLKAEKERLEQKYQEDRRTHAAHRFYAAFPLGVAAILLGGVLGLRAVGAGFMFGGLYAVVNSYAYELAAMFQLLGSLTVLVALVILGSTRLADRRPGRKTDAGGGETGLAGTS